MTRLSDVNVTASNDRVLADIMDQVTARFHAGERLELDDLLAEFPHQAERLQQLWPALQLLANVSQANGTPLTWSKSENVINELLAEPLGDFRLIREIGRGGMGLVYEAEQLSLGRRVALKVLPFAATMDSKQLQRFRNEAMAAASLRHENIVHVYGVGCERSVHFYAMELIEGQTLAQIIAALHYKPPVNDGTSDFKPADAAAPTAPVGALSTEFSVKGRELYRSAARVIADAADALEHAHSLGIVHRDIKPGNLMIDGAGKVYVTDFGLARFGPPPSQGGVGEGLGLTMSGDLLGTLRYMSPEQAMARHGLVDHRTDVYSLGATLYELLTGKPAVVGEDKQEVLKHIAFEEPTPLRKLDKSIPVELETITLKALAKNPAERYATAKELAEDLRRWGEDKPIKAKPPGRLGRLWKMTHRHFAVVLTATVGLFVTATTVGGTVGWFLRDREAQHRAAEARENETKRAIEADLSEAAKYQKEERWAESTQSLERAIGRLAAGGDNGLRERVAQMKRNVAMVTNLEQARMLASGVDDVEVNFEGGESAYRQAFVEFGLDLEGLCIEDTVRILRESAIRKHLITALDEWSFIKDRLRPGTGKSIQAIAQLADDDPLRQRLRDLLDSGDGLALELFAEEPQTLALPPAHLILLNQMLGSKGREPAQLKLLRKSQQCYPRDFWTNAILGSTMQRDARINRGAALEAAGFLRVALAIRPRAPQIQNILGVLLTYAKMDVEAEDAFRRAIILLPRYSYAYSNLGDVLQRQGNFKEAEAACLKAIELEPGFSFAYSNLGIALSRQGKFKDAEAACLKAIELKPSNAIAYFNLGWNCSQQNKLAEAEKYYCKAIELDPKYSEAHNNLGGTLFTLGKRTEGEAAIRKAIEFAPDHPDANGNLGRILFMNGQYAEALRYLRRGHELVSQSTQSDTNPLTQLIKDCEHLLELDTKLPRILNGELQPIDALESIELASICQTHKGLFLAAFRLYEKALSERTETADNLQSRFRHAAARIAVLAAAGQGRDTSQLNNADRDQLRKKALDWLKADLAVLADRAQNAAERPEVQAKLRYWQNNPDFISVRGETALKYLPENGRDAWRKLWSDVGALLERSR